MHFFLQLSGLEFDRPLPLPDNPQRFSARRIDFRAPVCYDILKACFISECARIGKGM